MIQIAKLPKDIITHYEHDDKGNTNITITELIRCKECEHRNEPIKCPMCPDCPDNCPLENEEK